jgi:phosphatidylinositol 4-kinase
LVILPFEVATPSAMSAGIEIWTWAIAEKPGIEVALMAELMSAWLETIKYEKGVFSKAQKYVCLPALCS